MDNLGLKKNTFYKLVKEHEQNISTKKDLQVNPKGPF